MRRVSVFLTTLVLTALLLAACGGQETSTSVPSTNVPPVTVEVTSTTDMTATEAPTGAPTEAMTTTPVVPVTGENSPSRASNLIGSSVCGMGGDQLGTVQDLVLDFDQNMVSYVVVDANGRNVAVPWVSFSMLTANGTGNGTGTGTGVMSTDTPSAGTGGTGVLGTDTPAAGGSGTLATDTPSAGSDMGSANCLTLTSDNDTFNNAPAFDPTTMPSRGQPAVGWDTSISSYWANPLSGGTGGSLITSTDTPSAGGASGSSTAVPTMTSSAGTTNGTGTGTGTGQGAQKMQGVMLASDVLGATVTVSPQGNNGSGTGNGNGTGTGNSANATATSTTGTGTETATPSSGSGTGTSTGDFSQGTVEDLIIEPMTGDMQYLVIRFGTQDNWIPIPVGFLRWDASSNGFVLMVNQNALQNAPAFSADQFPNTSASGWDQQFSTFWQNNGGMGTGTGSGGVTISTATATP